MMQIIQSDTFRKWTAKMRDRRAQALIAARLLRLARGMIGDTGSLGDGIVELRIHFGPGYRNYFLRQHELIIVLLCGGDKGTQVRDIQDARRIAREWRENHG